MKYIILLLFLSVTLNCFGQKLRIKIYNKTGFDIDSLYLDEKYIGGINKGGSIQISTIDRLHIQDGLPLELLRGVIRDRTKPMCADMFGFGYCGVGVHIKRHGRYKFDITVNHDTAGCYMLEWKKHGLIKF